MKRVVAANGMLAHGRMTAAAYCGPDTIVCHANDYMDNCLKTRDDRSQRNILQLVKHIGPAGEKESDFMLIFLHLCSVT